jgi:hypothetical protein
VLTSKVAVAHSIEQEEERNEKDPSRILLLQEKYCYRDFYCTTSSKQALIAKHYIKPHLQPTKYNDMGDAISSLLFQPPPPTYLHPSRHFWLNTSEGSRIPAFFIEKPNAKVTILFSHGNAEDLGMIYDWFNDLARVLRVNIMGYDYTGALIILVLFNVSPMNYPYSPYISSTTNQQATAKATASRQKQIVMQI